MGTIDDTNAATGDEKPLDILSASSPTSNPIPSNGTATPTVVPVASPATEPAALAGTPSASGAAARSYKRKDGKPGPPPKRTGQSNLPKHVPNRNWKLLQEAKRFKSKDGKSFERMILEIAVAEAIKGHPSLLTEMISRMYCAITPESTGIKLAPGNQNSVRQPEDREGGNRLSDHLGDAGTREAVAQLVERLAPRLALPGGNGNLRK